MKKNINVKFRSIQPQDNEKLKEIIFSSLKGMEIVGPGSTSEDKELKNLYDVYQEDGSKYCVVINEDTKEVFGGGGYSRLKGTEDKDSTCELQKFYFLPMAQGLGLGKKLLSCLLDRAQKAGYKIAYLETHHRMKRAVKLYEKYGFQYLDKPKGNTGHCQRSICMCKFL